MKNKIIGFRVTEQTKLMLDTVTAARGEDVSNFVRRAVLKELGQLGFLSENQRKALGI